MQRTYNPRKAKSNRSYTLQEVAILYDVNIRTVYAWVKAGLQLLDDNRPHMVHGPVLKKFLTKRQSARKWPKFPDRLPCFTCKGPRKVKAETFKIIHSNTDKIRAQGECEECGKPIGRGDVRANIADLERRFLGNPPR